MTSRTTISENDDTDMNAVALVRQTEKGLLVTKATESPVDECVFSSPQKRVRKVNPCASRHPRSAFVKSSSTSSLPSVLWESG